MSSLQRSVCHDSGNSSKRMGGTRRCRVLYLTFAVLFFLSFACSFEDFSVTADDNARFAASVHSTELAKIQLTGDAARELTRRATATHTPTPTSSPTPSRTPTLQPVAIVRDGAEKVQILGNDGRPTGQTAENHPADISDVQVTWLIDSSLLVCVNRFKTGTSFSSAINTFLLPASGTRPLAFFSWQLHDGKLTTAAEDAKGPLPADKWSVEFNKEVVAQVCFKIAASIADAAKRIEVNSFDRPKETDLRGFDIAGPFPLPERPR